MALQLALHDSLIGRLLVAQRGHVDGFLKLEGKPKQRILASAKGSS